MTDDLAYLDFMWDPALHEFQPAVNDSAHCWLCGYELDEHPLVTRRRFHDLRDSNATLLADLGVPEDVRMARLGHSTKAMARHYAAASVTQDRQAVELLAEALR